MRLRAFLATCLAMLLVYAPVVPAATPEVVGKINSRGIAEVNGTPMPSDATVFAGDRIATRKDSVATLALTGGDQVFLPKLSAAQVNRTGSQVTIALQRGALAVINRSSDSLVVETHGVRIQAAGKAGGIYEVAVNGKAVQVQARKGAALVTASNRTVEVKEGTTLDATVADPGPAGALGGLSPMATAVLATSTAAGLTGLGLGVAAITRSQPEDCKPVISPAGKIVCQ